MWRTLIITSGEKIMIRENWLIVNKDGEKPVSLPVSDIYCLVIDNQQLSVSIPTLTRLTENKTHVIICDERHLPKTTVFPLNANYHSLHILKKQMRMTESFKDELWERIIRAKIQNQAICLDNAFVDQPIIELLHLYSERVTGHDTENLEGQAARIFFKNLYSPTFHRTDISPINSALNYGYSILRSCMAKSLVSYGFNCVWGIHHCSEQTEFNLADDLMEPFRPVVDQYVSSHASEFRSDLTKENRRNLINIINQTIMFRGKKQRIRASIDFVAKSLVSAIEFNQASRLSLPELVREDIV